MEIAFDVKVDNDDVDLINRVRTTVVISLSGKLP